MTSQPGSRQQTDLACMRVAPDLAIDRTRRSVQPIGGTGFTKIAFDEGVLCMA